MLVLMRNRNESITIVVPPSDRERTVRLTVVEVRGNSKARLGFEAERDITIHRDEIWDRIEENAASAATHGLGQV